MSSNAPEFTDLLLAWSQGDDGALTKLVPMVYDDLHRVARALMRGERADHSLRTTGLVHEAYVRLRSAGTPAGAAMPGDGFCGPFAPHRFQPQESVVSRPPAGWPAEQGSREAQLEGPAFQMSR